MVRYDTGASLVRSFRNWQERVQNKRFVDEHAIYQSKTCQFAVCLANAGYEASLEVRKLYAVLNHIDAEASNLIRVIDESGEDYLYPARLFQRIDLPAELQRKLRLAS